MEFLIANKIVASIMFIMVLLLGGTLCYLCYQLYGCIPVEPGENALSNDIKKGKKKMTKQERKVERFQNKSTYLAAKYLHRVEKLSGMTERLPPFLNVLRSVYVEHKAPELLVTPTCINGKTKAEQATDIYIIISGYGTKLIQALLGKERIQQDSLRIC